MKKLFSLLTLALLTMSAWAGSTVTFDLTTGYDNGQEVASVNSGDVTITFDKGSNTNPPKWYSTGNALRMYGGNTATVVSTGETISQITFTFASGEGTNEITCNTGTFTSPTWTGNASSVVFTISGTSGHRRIAKIEVTLGEGGDTPVDPDPETGSTIFKKVTNVDELVAGQKYILVNEEYNVGMGGIVTYGSNNVGEAISGLTISEGKVDINGTNVKMLTLGGETGAWTFNFDDNTYISWTSGNTLTFASEVSDNAKWTIDGSFSLTNVADSNRRLQYNSGSSTVTHRFACYTSNQKPVVLYVQTDNVTPTVAAPVFDPASGHQFTGSLTVTMTSATEGANIVYTVNNGDEITAASPASVTIDTDATISAFAQKDGINSATVTATYTLKPAAQQVEYLEVAADLANNVEFEFTGNAVVTYQYNQYLYIKDETGYGLIYGSTNGGQNPKFAVGTMLAPGWAAKVSIYENLHEFVSTTGLDSCGITTVTPETITADQIPDKLNALVKIEHVKKVENGVATLIDGTTVTLYKRFDAALPTFDNADATITGIASVYGTTYQIYFISAEGAVNAPVITPASCNFEESQVVTITAGEGATIKYSTDEQATWNDYSEPLTITATTTVYAKAVKDGQESIVVSATYTKLEPVTYTLVTDVAQLAAGDKIILVGYCNKEGDDNYGKAYAMGAYRPNNNNFASVEVSVEDNTVTTVKANVITLETAAIDSLWNLKAAEGYLYAASSEKNQMMVEETPDANGNANALIYMATDSMSISFQGTNTRNFLRFNYNNGTPLFSCYKVDSNVQTPAYIFKAQSDTPAYQRGDVNMDGNVDINDVTRLIDVVLGKIVEYDATAADCNTAVGDGNIDINDVTALINRVLKGVWD